MCKSLKFKEEREKKEYTTEKNAPPQRTSIEAQRFDHISTQSNPAPAPHPTFVRLSLFPPNKKKESTNCFKLRH